MLDELFVVSLCDFQMKLDLFMQIRPNDDSVAQRLVTPLSQCHLAQRLTQSQAVSQIKRETACPSLYLRSRNKWALNS